MEKYYVQQLNSVTKKWANITNTVDFDTAEMLFKQRVSDPKNEKYNHKYRMIEISVISQN